MPHSLIGSLSASMICAGVHAAERDFGRGDEVEVVILDAVNLRLRSAGMKPMPFSTSPRARSGVIIGVKPSRTRRLIAYCCSASSSSAASFLRK